MRTIEVNTSIAYPFEVEKVNVSKFEARLMPNEADVMFHDEFNDGSGYNYVSVKWKGAEAYVPTVDFIVELNRALKANGIASGTKVVVTLINNDPDPDCREYEFEFEMS